MNYQRDGTRYGYTEQQVRGGIGAVPSTMIERRGGDCSDAISQGDMLIAAKQKRLMSASAGGASRKQKINMVEEDLSKINDYNQYMQKLMNTKFTRK